MSRKDQLKQFELDEDVVIDLSEGVSDSKENALTYGERGLKDHFAPPVFDRGYEDYMVVGSKWVRNFWLKGWPRSTYVGWIDDLYSYDGDLDLVMYIERSDDRTALDDLNNKITQYEAEYIIEQEKGSNRKTTMLERKISELYAQRVQLEGDQINLFQVSMQTNLYADSLQELKHRSEKIDNRLKGRRVQLEPSILKQDEGYKSVLPIGRNYAIDTYRNFNTDAIVGCFPFYNSEMIHTDGVYVGPNLSTGSHVFIDLFDRKFVNNSNATIFGEAGSGKTVFTSAFIYRNTLRGVRSVIVDPEGEYSALTESLQGVTIKFDSRSTELLNPFDVEEEELIGDDFKPTGEFLVDINGKISDVLNLIGVMAGDTDGETRSIVSFVIADLYKERGITEDPASLFQQDNTFDEATGEYRYGKTRKLMPTFSDFHERLEAKAIEEGIPKLMSLTNALRYFKKGGIYGMFDCQTPERFRHFASAPVVNFDVSKLEEGVLRPIGMYIALSWAWETFGKKNPLAKKFIIADEAWMLTSKHMKGYQYTSKMLENLARRARKRQLGLIVASQKFSEFNSSDEGRAVLTNSAMNIFLKTKTEDLDSVQEMFKISDGERNFLMQASRGEALIRTTVESAITQVRLLPSEYDLIVNKKKQEA